MKLFSKEVQGVLAVLATVFVPNAVFIAAWLLFNTDAQSKYPVYGLLTIAVILLVGVFSYYEKTALGNYLTVMSVLFGAICVVDATGQSPKLELGHSLSLALGAIALGGLVRIRLRPAQEPWLRLFVRLDLVRFAAFVLSQAWILLAQEGKFGSVLGAAITVMLIVWPVVACMFKPDFTSGVTGGKSLVGTLRWIMGFIVGKNLILCVQTLETRGPIVLLSFGLAMAILWLAYQVERPSKDIRVAEFLAVFGSGASTALRLIIQRGWSSESDVLVTLYGLVCLAFVARFVSAKHRQQRLHMK